MSWVLKGSTRVAFRQIHSIIDSCLRKSDHVPNPIALILPKYIMSWKEKGSSS